MPGMALSPNIVKGCLYSKVCRNEISGCRVKNQDYELRPFCLKQAHPIQPAQELKSGYPVLLLSKPQE